MLDGIEIRARISYTIIASVENAVVEKFHGIRNFDIHPSGTLILYDNKETLVAVINGPYIIKS